MQRFPLALCLCGVLVGVGLTGCSTSFAPAVSGGGVSSMGALKGTVHGGRQPIAGAHLYMYAAGVGAPGTASKSLLTAYSNGPWSTAMDGSGNYYATTTSDGSFVLDGAYTCTEGDEVYLYAVGGDPGSGQANSASALMAVLGRCPAAGNLASVPSPIFMTEVTTVAAAYAMAPFATDALHVSTSGTSQALLGLQVGFSRAAVIAGLSSGNGGANSANALLGQTALFQNTANSLANSLAACVNTANGSQCTSLFGWATSDGTPTGTQPTDTATAAINVAHYPGNAHAGDIYGLTAGIGAPFQPTLASAPSDWLMVALYQFLPSGGHETLAIDANDNLYLTHPRNGSNRVYKLTPDLTITFLSGNGLNDPEGVAIGDNGYVWVTNTSGDSLSVWDASGTPLASSPSDGQYMYPQDIAIDATNGMVWTASTDGSGVLGYNADTGYASQFIVAGGYPLGLAADPSGLLWVPDSFNVIVYEGHDEYTQASGTYPFNGLSQPSAVALDAQGRGWIPEKDTSLLSVFTAAGRSDMEGSTGSPFSSGGLNTPVSVVIDGADRGWVGNTATTTGLFSEFSDTGVALSPSVGMLKLQAASANTVNSIVVDGAGTVWASMQGTVNMLVEVIGSASPVVTPIATATKNGKLGQRP